MQKNSKIRRKIGKIVPYLFISPFYVLYAVFGVYTIFFSLFLSFHRWSGIGPWRWVGAGNYFMLLSRDPVFWASLRNNLFLWASIVPPEIFLSLVLAVLMTSFLIKGKGALRTICIIPYVTSIVIIAIVFRILYAHPGGWINATLRTMGIPPVPWLKSEDWSKISISLMVIWQFLGYYTLIMMGGLISISKQIYEAAEIDGASRYQIFFKITIPLMQPVIGFVMIIATVQNFMMFTEPFVLTAGGPRYSSITLGMYMYLSGFRYLKLGYASAISSIIFALIIVWCLVQVKYALRGQR